MNELNSVPLRWASISRLSTENADEFNFVRSYECFQHKTTPVWCLRCWSSKPLRLPQAQQVQPTAPQMYPAGPAAGCHSDDEAEEFGAHPRWSEAWKHHAGGPHQTALQSQSHWLWFSESRLEGGVPKPTCSLDTTGKGYLIVKRNGQVVGTFVHLESIAT